MATYLFTYNPNKWEWNFQDDIAEINLHGFCNGTWSAGVTKKIKTDDRFFLMRLGKSPRGIMASGRATSDVFQDVHWADESKAALYVNVHFDTIIDIDRLAIFPIELLQSGEIYSEVNWTPQASGMRIPDDVAKHLEEDWAKFLNSPEPLLQVEYDELINLPVESLEEITIDRENIESKLDFNPENLTDARERTNRSIVQRQGQSQFRSELLKAYGGKCAITDCDAKDALEAAHIFPYLGTDTNHVKNGLLLRADIHTLFDLYLISIDPDTSKVIVSSSLLNTCYKELNGKSLKSPQNYAVSPSLQALARHYETFLLKQNK